MLLDPQALQDASRTAGVLPTTLAKSAKWSVDRLTAITSGAGSDDQVTLGSLRRMAETLGVSPVDLLSRPTRQPISRDLGAQLACVLLGEPLRDLDGLAVRLHTTTDELRDAIDAWNADPAHAIRIVVRSGYVGLTADPRIDLPEPPPQTREDDASDALDADRLLWRVLDRQLPDVIDDELAAQLERLRAAGLVHEFDDHWRPADHIIELFDRTDWDTTELIVYARGRTSGPTASEAPKDA